MPSRVVFPGSFIRRIRLLQAAADDAGQIMPELERIAWEDNRDGLLAGQDKDGAPFVPLSPYTIRHRRSATGTADPNAPPLIPARNRSRAIANYRVTSFRKSKGTWVLLGAWQNVLSAKGVPFLGFHAEGAGRLPVRDIFGVRPEGQAKISAALKTWLLSRWSNP